MQANPNILPSSQAAIVGVIDPDATAAGTVTTGWIDMAKFEAIQAIILAGTLGTNATLDAKLEQATDNSGTGAKDVTGKAITQLTQAGTDDSDKQVLINCRAAELDIANDFDHVRLSITVATATSDAGAIVLGHYPHFGPASDHDLTSVTQIVE